MEQSVCKSVKAKSVTFIAHLWPTILWGDTQHSDLPAFAYASQWLCLYLTFTELCSSIIISNVYFVDNIDFKIQTLTN